MRDSDDFENWPSVDELYESLSRAGDTAAMEVDPSPYDAPDATQVYGDREMQRLRDSIDELLRAPIDESDEDWSYLDDFDDGANSAYIGPRYDYIDQMITKHVFTENSEHQQFVDLLVKKNSFVPERHLKWVQEQDADERKALELLSHLQVPTDSTPTKSILYPDKNATPTEQFFIHAHPFLKDYVDLKNAARLMESVRYLLAFAFYVLYFSQARSKDKRVKARHKPVVIWLQNIYAIAFEKIQAMQHTNLGMFHFYACCVLSKLALLYLSKKTPDNVNAGTFFDLASYHAQEAYVLEYEEKDAILRCIQESKEELTNYYGYKSRRDSRHLLRIAMRDIWSYPQAKFSQPPDVLPKVKLRFLA